MLRFVQTVLSAFGLDPLRVGRAVLSVPWFFASLLRFRRESGGSRLPLRLRDLNPRLDDRREGAGVASGHYFHQDLWAARKVNERRPKRHVDVGSRIDGFVAHLLVFMPVEVVDVRELKSSVDGLSFVQEDATELSRLGDSCLESVSSLHAIEHFGLGRYGDPIDPSACFRALQSLARVLSPGGRLYLSVPIGKERVEFNAHRVFSPLTVIDELRSLRLVSFAAVDDEGNLVPDADPAGFERARYACGLFEFTK